MKKILLLIIPFLFLIIPKDTFALEIPEANKIDVDMFGLISEGSEYPPKPPYPAFQDYRGLYFGSAEFTSTSSVSADDITYNTMYERFTGSNYINSLDFSHGLGVITRKTTNIVYYGLYNPDTPNSSDSTPVNEQYPAGVKYEYMFNIEDPDSLLSFTDEYEEMISIDSNYKKPGNFFNMWVVTEADGTLYNYDAFEHINFAILKNYINEVDHSQGVIWTIVIDFTLKYDVTNINFQLGSNDSNDDYFVPIFNHPDSYETMSEFSTFDVTVDQSPVSQFYLLDSVGPGDDDDSNFDLSGIEEGIQGTNDKLDDLNDNITNSDISGANDSASDLVNSFEDKDYGLSDIITIPLATIESITSNSCNSLVLPLPFVDKNITLPCMNSIYSDTFGLFFTMYQTITTGIIGYYICVNVYRLVKGFKDPTDDKIEVMEL